MRLLILILTGLLLATPMAVAAPSPPFTLFPVVGGAHYADDFGKNRGAGTHQGNDLLAPCGMPTVAVVAGTVSLDYGARSGYMLTLKGRDSWYRYIHMDGRNGAKSAFAAGLRDGSRVRVGQIIAYVGNTGDAAGGACHLHFELHHGTRTVSPFSWLQQATILQIDPTNPASAAPITTPVVLTIKGRVAWAATTASDGCRIIVRSSSITASDGSKFSASRLITLRADPALIASIVAGRRVTIVTTPALLTTGRQDLLPLTWTAVSVS